MQANWVKLKRTLKLLFFIALCTPPLILGVSLLVYSGENNTSTLITRLNNKDSSILPVIDDVYDSILTGNYESIIKQISEYDPDGGKNFQGYFAQVAEYIKQFKILKQNITDLRYNFNLLGDKEIYRITIQKEIELMHRSGKSTYFTLDMEFSKLKNNTWLLTKVIADGADSSIKQINGVTWGGTSYLEKSLIIGLIFIPIFILIAVYLCLFKTNIKHKWLWVTLIMLGFMQVSHNFTHHTSSFDLVSFILYGASFWRPGLYGELTISIGIPIGAIVFMTMYMIKYNRRSMAGGK